MGEPLVGFIAEELGPLHDCDRFRADVVGAEINLATGLVRLGVPTALIARTGTDELGELVLRHVRREGIDARHVTRVDHPTGILLRSRRAYGASSVLYRREGSASSTTCPEDVLAAAETIAGAAWFHVSGVTAALSDSCRAAIATALRIAREAGATTSLDLNYRARLWSPEDAAAGLAPLVAAVDVTLAGAPEGEALTGAATPAELVARLRAWGAREVVVKRGAAGAYLDRGGAVVERPARAVDVVVDEVGAGDAFAAGFIAARLRGAGDAEALDWAATVAAFSLSAVGDGRGLPTAEDVERALATDTAETIR